MICKPKLLKKVVFYLSLGGFRSELELEIGTALLCLLQFQKQPEVSPAQGGRSPLIGSTAQETTALLKIEFFGMQCSRLIFQCIILLKSLGHFSCSRIWM